MSELLERFSQIGRPRILVLGDLMLDRYTWGDAERVSPEAPVIVLRADQEEIRPGGAASVAYLLRHLDADVSLAGVIGNDTDGHTLRALLRDEGIDERFVLVDPTRPTTSKQRLVGRASDRHPHQILRVDRESRQPLSEQVTAGLWDALQAQLREFDAILVADYLKGVCTPQLLRWLIDAARYNDQPVLIDPGRLPDYERYRGATLLKPNRLEAELECGGTLSSSQQVIESARRLRSSLDLQFVVITLDREGLVVASATDHAVVSSTPRPVYDITGAGDMVLATLGFCVAGGLEPFESAHVANIAAGLEVERFGVAPVKREEIGQFLRVCRNSTASKVVNVAEMTLLMDVYRRCGRRIVFTNGCFDLLHVGHITCLEQAAELGDILVVGANSDASVKRLKGSDRPVISEQDRARMLAALNCVHHVVIFEEDTPECLLRKLRPDVLAKGGTTTDIVGREIIVAYGGQVCSVGLQPNISTTRIVSRIQIPEGET